MTTDINTFKQFLQPKDIAGLVGVSRQTVHNWIRKGHFPATRVGRTYIIQTKDFYRFLDEREVSKESK